jgi:hypothetical protein
MSSSRKRTRPSAGPSKADHAAGQVLGAWTKLLRNGFAVQLVLSARLIAYVKSLALIGRPSA